MCAVLGKGALAKGGTRSGSVAMRPTSRSFHLPSKDGVRQAADQAGVDQAGIAHAGHMARVGEHALDVPDGLLRLGEVVGQEAAAIFLGEKSVKAPHRFLLSADIQQLNDQQVARLGTFDANRAAQKVDDRQVDVAHVVRAVVVLDEAAGPVVGFQHEVVAGVDPGGHGDVRVPTVVDVFVFVGRLVEVNLDESFRHAEAP